MKSVKYLYKKGRKSNRKPIKFLRSRLLKRIFDIIIAVVGLIVFSPVMLIVSILIIKKMGSPVLFRQLRPGLNGKPFVLYKFRTMTDERDEKGRLLPDEKRLTPLGKFLREHSIDELPQLFNVLKGDMSIVGPRPLLIEYLDRYTPEQARRHEVKPGITGWAQINGRNTLTWEEKFEFDVWYVDNWDLILDLKIIILTIWNVLKKEGISAEGHVTMPEFRGSHGTKEEEEKK
ncbi:MAG: sugar transferase [Fervidobacterium sp.]